MAEFAALPLFTDSWVADTSHLKRAERGLYHDLLVLMWRSPECRVPNDLDWIGRKLRVEDWEEAALAMIVKEFCSTTGNWLFQKRLQKEFHYVRVKSGKQSDRAKSRWNKEKVVSHGNAPSPTPTYTPKGAPGSRNGKGHTLVTTPSSPDKLADGSVWVDGASDAGLAWDQHRLKAEGRRYPRDHRGGWYHPSQWPPEMAGSGVTPGRDSS